MSNGKEMKSFNGYEIVDNHSREQIEQHIRDTIVHVTKEEKDAWNAGSSFSGSWNDLKDKPFYEVLGETIFDEAVTTNKDSYVDIDEILLNIGDILNITIGNEEYSLVRVYELDDGVMPGAIAGNKYLYLKLFSSLVGATVDELLASDPSIAVFNENTGEPFFMCDVMNNDNVVCGTALILDSLPNTTVHLTISKGEIKQIDEKYIPETIARVSDIEKIVKDVIKTLPVWQGGAY